MSAKGEIRTEAARVLEAATYASETQFEYSKRWRRVDRWIGSVAAALAAVAGVGGLSQAFSARWAGLIAVLAAGTGAVAASIGAPQNEGEGLGVGNRLSGTSAGCPDLPGHRSSDFARRRGQGATAGRSLQRQCPHLAPSGIRAVTTTTAYVWTPQQPARPG
jgi:hypothetical protein